MVKRQGAEYWRRHLEAWHQSNLSEVDYCVEHGLSTKSFYRWRGKEKEAVAVGKKSALTLVPITVNTPGASSGIRLHSPGGWRVELGSGSVSWLAELLRRLP